MAEIALKLLELLPSPAIVLGKEEPARARCRISVVRDADASTRAGSGRASLKATTLRTKQRLEINSTHERATFAAASYLPF